MPNEFKLSGSRYVSKSGNDANAGTDPNAPKLTFAAAFALSNVVVGTGIYEEKNITHPQAARSMSADGVVIFKGDKASAFFTPGGANRGVRTYDCIFVDYVNVINGTGRHSHYFKRCIFINCTESLSSTSSIPHHVIYDECIFINCTINANNANSASITGASDLGGISFLGAVNLCTFINTYYRNLSNSDHVNCRVLSSYSDGNIRVAALALIASNIRGTIQINGDTTYASLAALQAAASAYADSISDDPLFVGDPAKLEMTVRANSPNIAKGANGANIGNVKTGNLQRYDTLQWGLSPASNSNTRFLVDNTLEVITGNIGTRESKEIDMGQIVRSPVIRLTGIVDFVNNVPDFQNLTNPNHLTVELRYAGLDKVYTSYKSFRVGEKIMLDDTGKSTGESGFDWSGTVDVDFRYIQVRITLKNNYSPS